MRLIVPSVFLFGNPREGTGKGSTLLAWGILGKDRLSQFLFIANYGNSRFSDSDVKTALRNRGQLNGS
jgi:hypothetical protein